MESYQAQMKYINTLTRRRLRLLIRRDGGKKCRYCRHQLMLDEMTVDHVKPKARGGAGALWNLVIACQKCNAEKADKKVSDFVLGARNSQYATKLLNDIRSQHKSLRYE